MSNVARVAGQAANTLVKPLEVEQVFSTYLYTGNNSGGSTPIQTITNGIDLDGEGGLVWLAGRSTTGHNLYDTERGVRKYLESLNTSAESTAGTGAGLTSFNSDGFTLGKTWNTENFNGYTYASWTFRKTPKFFDVVTYTGDGTGDRQISHNLGSTPGCIIVKSTTASGSDWAVYHRGSNGGTNPAYYPLFLNATSAASAQDGQFGLGNEPSSTTFTVNTDYSTNNNGSTYVAYLFAHNDGDGEFGPNGNADAIKCGSYTGTGATGNNVNLGFEPQWLMIKRANSTGNWQIADVMRGMPNNGGAGAYQRLSANLGSAEVNGQEGPIPTSTGFVLNSTSFDTNGSGGTYIYIAIRRPTAVPTDATEVFDVGNASETGSTAPEYESGFTVDMAIKRIMSASQSNYVFDRLRGGQSLASNLADSESAFGAAKFDYMNGYYNGTSTSSTNWSAMWKRAPKFFDVVAYEGNSGTQTLNHNLGVTPELIIVKARESYIVWAVWSKSLEQYELLQLSTNNAKNGSSGDYGYWTSTAPTNTQFSVGTYDTANKANEGMIAYLFASLDGISKVGSYSGSASAQTIDCGFTAGARFVLIKRTDQTGSWVVWDTNRGIVAGNDPYFQLNSNSAPTTTDDYIDPHNSGFTIAGSVGFINTSGGSYIFYAIA